MVERRKLALELGLENQNIKAKMTIFHNLSDENNLSNPLYENEENDF